MSFVSIAFLLFLPVVFVLHWAGRSRVWQNTVVVAASYLFYGWWDWRFCFLLLGVSLASYVAGAAIDQCRDRRRRRLILIAAIGAHLGALGCFKYFDFFMDSLALALSLGGWDIPTARFAVILPAGISFYTFQGLSYALDIYRGQYRRHRSLLDYLAYISFFPQLVAGPIERAGQLLPQYAARRAFDLAEAREGGRLILWGFFKKMVLADNLALLVDQAYAVPTAVSGAALMLATLAFAFQIYCDFSAYSDIAVGTARLFGIRLSRNFAYPYFAQSLSEFWRRWHISLSTWFRDYVYIPLGGSRTTPARTARNLLLTGLVSGLWHGAAWHFVGWGTLHGVCLGSGRFLSLRRIGTSGGAEKRGRSSEAMPGGPGIVPSCGAVLRMGRTFGLVCLAWVLFRARSFEDAWIIYGSVLGGLVTRGFYAELGQLAIQHAALLLALIAFVAIEWLNRRHWNALALGRLPLPVRWAIYTGLVWVCVMFGTEQTGEFIYFRF